jgi:hypothetical protein
MSTVKSKGDLVTEAHSIFNRWRNHFSQLLNVCKVNDVRQTGIHWQALLAQPRAFEVEMPIQKLKGQKSPGGDQSQQN